MQRHLQADFPTILSKNQGHCCCLGRKFKKLVWLVREITKQLGILNRGKSREAQVDPFTEVTYPCCS